MRNEEERCKISLTIEQQLKRYTDDKQKTERHEILWHAWNHNKHWLRQLQQWILTSYPQYSQHDESHSMSVLQNIEMLLGESQIGLLSASDCFLILHLAYIHDIGMCITYEDRLKLVRSTEFINFLEEKAKSNNGLTVRYAKLLLTYCRNMPEITSKEGLLEAKLDIHYAILYLISDFNRSEHGDRAKNILNEWIDKPEKLGIGFSTSGIPSRFFHTIASCASTHTSWDFEDVMNLSKEDSGFAHDYMHPRFAAIMLQLGDALDLDNDRFHPLVKEFLGELPYESMLHMKKHAAIRRLRISPSKISIVARSDSAEVLRLIYQECNGIRDILRNAAFHWSAICPSELTARIPEFEKVQLFLNDQEVDESVVNSRFQIQQKRAFKLLQGENFYIEGPIVFLREIIQNAIDASKLQYWTDWKGSRWFEEKRNVESYTIDYIGRYISPFSYPIEIELHLARKEKDGNKYQCLDTQRDVEKIEESEKNSACKKEWEYGVLVKVADHGIGITQKDIPQIANVGSGYEKRKDKLKAMPSWMQPTAEFGIGLQSVYLVSNRFVAKTRTHDGNGMKMEFCVTEKGGNGFINAIPLDDKDSQKFGTTFEVFLSNKYKTEHQKDLDSWSGQDPFGTTYEEDRNVRHARELVVQLAYYINSLIGEKIFPIELRLYDYEEDLQKSLFTKTFLHKLDYISCQLISNGKIYSLNDAGDLTSVKDITAFTDSLNAKSVTWAYQLEYPGWINGSVEEIRYAWDLGKMKLYLWDEEHKVCARFGIDRIQARREKVKNPDVDERKTNMSIYYKGIYATNVDWKMDADLLEYIDIKEKLKGKYITLGRDFFTKKGGEYVEERVYTDVVKALHKVLDKVEQEQWEYIEKHYVLKKGMTEEEALDKAFDIVVDMKVDNLKKNIIRAIWRELFKLISDQNHDDKSVQGVVLAAIAFAGFAQIRSGSVYFGIPAEEKHHVWSYLLEKISLKIEEEKNKGKGKRAWVSSTFFNIQRGVGEEDVVPLGTCNIADVLRHEKKFVIISKRTSVHRGWREYLVDITDEPDMKQLVLNLKTEWNWEKRKEISNTLENWGARLKGKFLQEYKRDISYENRTDNFSQDMILRWLLDKIPSIAMFSSEDCTIRINVLDLEHTDSMYFDVSAKWSIYERMAEYYDNKGIERFSTIASTGYCQMAVTEQHPSVYFVKRGLLAKIGQRYMIMPFTGEVLKWILEKRDEITSNKKGSKLHKVLWIFPFISTYLRNEIRGYREWSADGGRKLAWAGNPLFPELIDSSGGVVNWISDVQERLRSKLEKMSKNEDLTERISSLFKKEELKLELEEKELEMKWPSLLEYLFDKGDKIEETKKWVEENIFPRYYMITNTEIRQMVVEWLVRKEDFIEELRFRCGLLTKEKSSDNVYRDATYVNNDEARNSTKNLISYVERNGWTHATEKQLYRFLEMFIKETADELEGLCKKDIDKMIRKIPILHLETRGVD